MSLTADSMERDKEAHHRIEQLVDTLPDSSREAAREQFDRTIRPYKTYSLVARLGKKKKSPASMTVIPACNITRFRSCRYPFEWIGPICSVVEENKALTDLSLITSSHLYKSNTRTHNITRRRRQSRFVVQPETNSNRRSATSYS